MSSDSMQTLPDPVLQSKMPLFDVTMASTGLTKSQNMSGFLGKQALQYNGSCFTYDPRGKDGAGFTSPWRTKSKASLLDGSPMTHLSGTEKQNHIIYRQDTSSSEEGHSHSSPMHHASVKRGFMLYAKSPEISSPTPAIRKQTTKAGSENSSSHSESSVYLAIPKPVYRHNPCCNELGCMIGQRYPVEHSSARIPNTIYEHDWMQTEAHYIERSPLPRKAQDTLLQQRGLHFEAGTEPLKRITVEPYSPGKATTLSAMMESNYSSYPCTPSHTLFGSLSEHSQPLQTSPRGYPSLYPSQPTYEHMTSEVYQEHSLMPKYGPLAQHPMFYYPQANVEVENRSQCKDSGSKQSEDGPVIHKRKISNPRERYIVPQPLHAEIPLPTTEMLPNPYIQGFDYPCYAIQRFHLNPSQIRPPLKRPNTSPSLHSSHINVSPPGQPHPTASATSLHKDHKSSIGLQVDQFHDSSFVRVDQISPTRRASHHGVSPSSIQIGRYFSPLTGLLIDPPIPTPAGINMNRLLDYSSCETQVTCPKQPQSLPVSRAAWLPHSPKHSADRIHTAACNGANVRKIIYSPAVATGSKHNGSVTSPGNGVHKGSLKRSISHSSPPMKIKEEDNDVYEVEVSKKPKMEMEDKNDSPPMPIIDTVFSLAPYHACLQTSGVLIPGRAPQTAFQDFEQHEIKPRTEIKRKTPDRDEKHSVTSVVSKDPCPEDTPTEQTAVEPKYIKGERVNTLDTDETEETFVGENECIKVTIKKEAEETDAPDSETVVLQVKCEPDELENKPSLADENQSLDESKHAALPAQMSSLSHDDTYTPCTMHQPAVTLQPQTTASPPPPESKVDFKNIPPRCLKLSTYNIIIPDIKHYSPAPLPEKQAAQPEPQPTPKEEAQMPVRKHFLELHHSLCKLVSKSVSACAEHELKNWLSQLQINEPVSPSTKVQKVSCLLGVKAREVWLNEEMKTALDRVLDRLREYTTQERCPFPHVMRTGAVFLPMLVVKELLFPMVQGSFIDQVLQEHRVELRPTTLSEEKILIQLHKRACSSRLRRLMSLKHLPDVYADVVNLLHYTYVCKHLGLDTDPDYREQDGGCEASNSRGAPEITASSDTPSYMKDQETHLHLNRNRTKSRVKSSSRRMFLDDSLSDKEEAGNAVGGVLNTFTKKKWAVDEPQGTENSGTDHMVTEQDSPLVQQTMTSENSWTCPLSFNELSSSDTEAEESSSLWPVSQSSGPAKPRARAKNFSGVILKLRKMLSEGLNRKKACYQAVSESETFADPSLSQTGDGEGGSSETDPTERTPSVTHRWQRTGSFPHALRPLAGSSKRKKRSLLKIKYCPYLSACHSAEHRKRWVLRSAVQTARRTMRFYYPDLVGKRIHHLYEEDDKSEVWYRGEVLRIHEAHTNPLKTIFEVRYDSEPEWKYYLELLIDYKKGWLKIED